MTSSSLLDSFISRPDIRERFESTIHAPRGLVMEVASSFDLQSIPWIRAIFWLREKVMRAPEPAAARKPQGLLAEMQELGWGTLMNRPGELFVGGAVCQPWLANVTFTPIPADQFASYAEPNQVKIAWTLETEAFGPAVTRFTHETRALATDAAARACFARYWRWARFGIVAIRLLLLPAIRRTAEREWAARQRSET